MDNLIKTLRLKSLIVFTLLFLTVISNAAIIKGRITDLQTHKSIPGAAVSIIGTKIVTLADNKGEYVINNLQPGTYSLISTCMGYKNSAPIKIELAKSSAEITRDIILEPSVIQMNEVVITSV